MSWSEYREWVQTLTGLGRDFLFRGQANPTWKLRTSFHRCASPKHITVQDYVNSIVPNVHLFICAHLNEILDLRDPGTFGSFLALLQHHGFPTPLLDWTLSPYMAAYFAFRDANVQSVDGDSVKVYAFDIQEWERTFEQPLDLREMTKRYVSHLIPYAKYNSRLIPQQGRYTVTNVDDIERYVASRENEVSQKFLYSALLPLSERQPIMQELALMGITEMTLFPGLDGICRTLKGRHFGI